MKMDAMGCGIVGVGKISDTFIGNMGMFANLKLVGCTARNMEHIKAKAEQHGIKPMTMDEMMDDKSIEMVLNLTPVSAHYGVIKRALEAGKHVYTEKTLTDNYSTARELADLAASKGLCLGCAPDTFLGSGVQTAAEALANGSVGEVTGFTVMLNRGLDLLYEFMDFLLQPGAGMGYDFGIYALTAVLSMLGPVDEVAGFYQTSRPNRVFKLDMNPKIGQPYEIKNENVMAATLRLKSGVIGTVMFNGDSVMPEKPYICIQGTEGLLYLPDPNSFGGEVIFQKAYAHPRQIMAGGEPERILETHHRFSENSRGLGAAEMVSAIRGKRRHRAHAEMACHLLELLDGVVKSCDAHSFVKLNSTFEVPERLNGNEKF
jgi:predicted dehydrogenase